MRGMTLFGQLKWSAWPQNEFAAKLASVLLPLAIGFHLHAFFPALGLQYWLRLPIYIQKSCAQAAALRHDELRSTVVS